MKQLHLTARTALAIPFFGALLIACGQATEPPSHDEIMREDLGKIISVRESNCGSVLGYTVDDRMDFRVECESGEVYRIHVSPEGRVNVDPHESDN
jgi:hypothetical protein